MNVINAAARDIPTAAPAKVAPAFALLVSSGGGRSDPASVYLAENENLPEADRHELRKVQRLHVGEWVRLLGALRPELATPEARMPVHAALNLVTDLSRWVGSDRRSGMDRHLVRPVRTCSPPDPFRQAIHDSRVDQVSQ